MLPWLQDQFSWRNISRINYHIRLHLSLLNLAFVVCRATFYSQWKRNLGTMQYTHTFAISSKSSSGNIIMRIFCEKILIKRTNLHYISTDTLTFNIITQYRWTKRQLHEKTGKIAARCNRTLSLQFGNNLFVRIHLKTCQHDGLLHHTWLLRSWYSEPSIYLSATLHRLNCPIDHIEIHVWNQ